MARVSPAATYAIIVGGSMILTSLFFELFMLFVYKSKLPFFEQYLPFYIMIDKCREKKDNRDGTAQFRTELYFTHSRYANFSMFLQGFKE